LPRPALLFFIVDPRIMRVVGRVVSAARVRHVPAVRSSASLAAPSGTSLTDGTRHHFSAVTPAKRRSRASRGP
jgi:hypothetical protein